MRRSAITEGVEYAVRNNSATGTLYRATFVGDRVVTESRREIGYPARDEDVRYLVFRIEAVITRPYGADPTEVGGELLVANARFVEATWDVHMQWEEADRERRDRDRELERGNRIAILAALRTLGVTVGPELRGEPPLVYDLPSSAIRGTGVGELKDAFVELPAPLLLRMAALVTAMRVDPAVEGGGQ